MGVRGSIRASARRFVILVTAVWLGGYIGGGLAANPQGNEPRDPGATEQVRSAETAKLEVLLVQKDVYLIAGAGGNIAVQVGPEGLIVVDTGDGTKSDQVLGAIHQLSDKQVRYIINTSVDLEHTGGNAVLGQAGAAFRSRNSVYEGAEVVAQENVLMRMSAPTGAEAPTPSVAWPTSTYFVPEMDLFLNGQAIRVMHQPAAHTDGDSVVYFRGSDVIVAGDVYDNTRYPIVDQATGGSITGMLGALNRLLDIAVAGNYEEGGTMIVPGHGRISDEADLVEYRDMVTIVRDRIQAMVKKGRSLEQVKAATPSLEYDAIYASSAAATNTFVEAIYRDLAGAKVTAPPKTR